MLQGTDLVILGTVGTLVIFIAGFFVGKRNGSKLDNIVASTVDSTTARIEALEARAKAVEDGVLHLLKTEAGGLKTSLDKLSETK